MEKRVRPVVTFTKPSRTKKSFKNECDVNHIMSRYTRTGQLPNMIRAEPKYGNFANVKDFQESMNVVLHANEQFEALPAEVRKRFGHDPSRMLEFVADPNNKNELIKMGLAVDRPAPVTSDSVNNLKAGDSASVGDVNKDVLQGVKK